MAKTVKLLSEDVYRDPMEITLWSRKEPGRYIGRVYQPRHMSFTCWAGETRAKDDVRPPGQTFPYWTGADAIDRAIDAVIAAENAARCAELTPHDSYAEPDTGRCEHDGDCGDCFDCAWPFERHGKGER